MFIITYLRGLLGLALQGVETLSEHEEWFLSLISHSAFQICFDIYCK